MRIKVGLVTTALVASVLSFGTPSQADTTTTSSSTTTTTTTTTSTTTSTTTTVPGAVTGGATVGGSGGAIPPSLPQRGESQVVLVPPPPNTFGLPANSGTGRRAVYSKSEQQVWVVNSDGIVIKNHRVSGKQVSCDPTPGTYQVFSRSRYTFAIQNPAIIWGYMVRFAHGCQGGNIGFHEIPTDTRTGGKVQTVAQLGTPLSGGCVRQSVSDAVWMWNWAYVGTKVVVLP